MGRGLTLFMLLAAGARAQLPKSQLDLQREGARSLEPVEIELRQTVAPFRGTLKVRVYAARDYRAQTFDWSARFARVINRVNRALSRWPNVRLEIVEVKRWEHDSAGVPLGKLVEELEAEDRGRDVDFVVGLAVAVPTLPEQIHNLGMARELGRHFVVRSLHDLAEYEVMKSAFDQMSPPERERLMALRKAHKETVIFLHELFHTLGLVHAQRWQRIMNPSYHHGQSQLSELEARMVELALEKRNTPASFRAELSRLVEREADPEWDPRDRDHLRALLSTGAAPSSQHDAEIDRALAERDPVKAYKQLVPLFSVSPDDSRLQQVGCKLAAAQPLPYPIETLNWLCGRAVELERADASPLLSWAEGQLRQHLSARADETVMHAEARLALGGSPEGWRRAAELRRALEEPTLALEDATKAGAPGETETWAHKARQEWLLPEGARLAPTQEGEYVRLVKLALQALEGARKAWSS